MGEKFDFTLKERLFLANQYRILEALYPHEAKDYAQRREIVESGYRLNYDSLDDSIIEEDMSPDECKEVLDILDMHRAFKFSREKAGIDAKDIRFRGFDGNNETKQMAYARFLMEDQMKWKELSGDSNDLNSHFPSLPRYRSMLRKWKKIDPYKRFELTKAQIEDILETRPQD